MNAPPDAKGPSSLAAILFLIILCATSFVRAQGGALPTITSVTPDPVPGSSSAQAFAISGTNFDSTCTITLRDLTSGQIFPNRPIIAQTATSITLNPNFTTAAHSWSVEVINSTGGSSGQFPFSVVAPITGWVTRTSGTTNPLFGIASGNGTIVAVGAKGTILTSTDGQTWISQTSGTSDDLSAVTFGNGLYVAGGSGGIILTSPDAVHWTNRGPALTYNVYTLTFGDGLFAGGGEVAYILTSPDGISWTNHGTFGQANLYGATWSNGLFVVGGYYDSVPSTVTPVGIVVTSPDGTNWTRRNVGTLNAVHGVAYGNGTFVAVGDGGSIETSPDGINWSVQNSSTTAQLLGLTYGNGFIAVGPAGFILSSSDGKSWAESPSVTSNDLYGGVYVNGTFLIVGDGGTILQSNSVPASAPLISSVSPNPLLAQNGNQTLTISGWNLAPNCTVTLRDLGTGTVYPNYPVVSQGGTQIVVSDNFTSTPSTWSVEVINAVGASSGQYRFQVGSGIAPSLVVEPVTGATFTPVQIGSSSISTFTLTNNGTTAISGAATVTGSFAIVGTASYALQPGQQQTFTVQFKPTGVGFQNGYLSFSGGAGASIQLSGSANPIPNIGSITGTVVDSITGKPIDGVKVATLTGSQDTTSLSSATGQDGAFTLPGIAPGNYILSVYAPGTTYYYQEQPINVAVGSATVIEIQLVPAPTPLQMASLPQNIPIVLVRGLGSTGTPDTYWTQMMAALLMATPAFTNVWDPNQNAAPPVLDGTQSIDSNAAALLAYISQQVADYKIANGFYPPCIEFVTHSMGGLIVRESLNNEAFIACNINGASVAIPVKQVIMLGTPNAGTVLADLAVSGLGKIVGTFISENWVSTACLTTDQIRNNFNHDYYWPCSVPCFRLAATGGLQSQGILSKTSILMIDEVGDLTPEMVVDGAVSRPSVSGQYYTSPTVYTQSINLGPVDNEYDVTDVQAIGRSIDHLGLLSDVNVEQWVIQILGSGTFFAQTGEATSTSAIASANGNGGAFAANMINQPTENFFNQIATLSPGSDASLNVACDAATTFTLNLMTSGSGINFTLQDPSGNNINSTSPQTNPNVGFVQDSDPISGVVFTTYTINAPTQGTWTVTLDGSGITSTSVTYQLSVSGDSSLVLQPTTSNSFHNGQEAVISCSLLNTRVMPPTPISATSVIAQIVYPDSTVNTQTLLDDGFHADGAPNDGIYGAILPNLSEPGRYFVTYLVAGSSSASQPYMRYATSVFTVSTEDASIAGNLSSQPTNLNAGGTSQSMCVRCSVNAVVPGTYLLSALLTDSTGTLNVPASVRMENAPVGTSDATLYFNLSAFESAGFTGAATLSNIQLSEQTSTGIQWLDAYPAPYSVQIGPQIAAQPQNVTLLVGGSGQMSVSASGDGTLSYQWLLNGAPLAGQTGSTLALNNVTLAQAGNYSVLITSETGTVRSSNSQLTIQESFSQWAASYGVTDNPGGNPQNDGVPNLLKYLYDINPVGPISVADRGALPAFGTTTAEGTRYLTLTYRENPAVTGITLNLEISSDLKTWVTVTNPTITQTGTDLGTGDPIMQFQTTGNGSSQFLRLNVTSP